MTTARVQKQRMTFRSDAQQDYISQSLHRASRAVHLLQREGFCVERVELGGMGKPKIEISWHPRAANLGVTRSYSKGNNGSDYETYLVDFEQCQVSWVRK